MRKLKQRWNIRSNWRLFVVFLVFAVTGSTSAKFAGPMTELTGLSTEAGWYIYWPVRVLIIFPIYQVLLVFFGWLYGEYLFFWNFEKKILRYVGLGFLVSK